MQLPFPPFSVLKVILFLTLLPTQQLHAQQRVALLIGNANYQNETILANPVNDAELLAKTFKDISFDQVIVLKNANRVQINTALAQFKKLTKDADVAVVYYSGHGMMSSNKQNFVLPTDMPKLANNANADLDLELENNAISADKMVDVLSGSKIKVLILDACRDGPTAKFKSANKGLARMSQAETKGMLIAYATEEGKVAEDGAGTNSTYAASLAKYFAQKDLSILAALDNVAKDVEIATQSKQSPTRYGNLRVDAFLNFEKIVVMLTPTIVPSPTPVPVPVPVPVQIFVPIQVPTPTPTPLPLQSTIISPRANPNIKPPKNPAVQLSNAQTNLFQETEFWNRIKSSQNKVDFESYLNTYPSGNFTELAQSKLKNLIDIEPANLMKTDLMWRNESMAINDFEQISLEKKSDMCDAKATFLLVENPHFASHKNPDISKLFKNIKCVVDNTNHPLLMHSLANFYLYGLGTEVNHQLAFEWYSKASALENLNSLNSLGDLYLSAVGVEEDILKAYNAYYKAAELGNPSGMNSLGNFYHKGFIVEKNHDKAYSLYKAAAMLNYGPAMYNLGTYYLKGLVIDKNNKEAFYWIHKSAQHGHSDAMVHLVQLYQNGIGVDENAEAAEKWWHESDKFFLNRGYTNPQDDLVSNLLSVEGPSQ